MLVRFLVGKRAGVTQHVPRNDSTVAMLINSGMAEEVLPGSVPKVPGLTPAAAGTPDTTVPFVDGVKWGVKVPPFGDEPHLVRLSASETTYFANPNAFNPQTRKPSGWPVDCPQDARELFEREYGNYLARRRSAAETLQATAGNKR